MFVCKFRLNSFYREVPKEEFAYFPLHVPMDVALTVRSPHCLDQYHLIDLLCRSLPFGKKLAIKEHPAMVGVLQLDRVLELLRKHENLVLLRPTTNNYDVLSKCEFVFTVNSKSGAEALMIGKKVLAFGDAFYSQCPLIKHSSDLGKIDQLIPEIMNKVEPSEEVIYRYFQSVWDASFQGEIYSLDLGNIKNFVKNICV